jgi:dTDP-4-dehydrorhamnose reductase
MKIFITGGSGMLGQFLNLELSEHHQIITQFKNNPGNCKQFNSIQLDIIDADKIKKVFEDFHPNIVIHTAAVSNAEKADALAADLVYDFNVNATKTIAELCGKYNSKLVYTSTDTVYAGYRGSMLKEDAKLIPISLYAETKLMGEIKIRETLENFLILRIPLQIGLCLGSSLNNFHKLYNNLKAGVKSKLYTDQYRTPLALHETARIIREIVDKNIEGEIVNIAGNERVNRFEIGELLCDAAGFDKNLLIPLTMEEGGAIYKVADVSMNNDKMKSYGINPKPLYQMIEESLKIYEKRR